MLNKKDKEWIRGAFQELITEALTVEVMMERRRDPETGVPLKTPRVEKKKVYLPAHWVEFLPFYEQAIVGVQETGDKAKNRAFEARNAIAALTDKVDTIGNLYVSLEKPLKVLAAFSDVVQQYEIPGFDKRLKLVHSKNESDPTR